MKSYRSLKMKTAPTYNIAIKNGTGEGHQFEEWHVDGVLQSRVEVYLGTGPTKREKIGNCYILRNVPLDQNPLDRSGELGCVSSKKRPGFNLLQLDCTPDEDPHRAMALFSRSVKNGDVPETETLEWIAGIFDKFRESKNSALAYTLDELFCVAGNERISGIIHERRDKLISRDFFLLKKLFGFSQDGAVQLVLGKAEAGLYFKNSLDNITVEIPQSSAKGRFLKGERQLKTIATRYEEYWENRFFISPDGLPDAQDFRATFPPHIQKYYLKNPTA
jgi:hypothetical protein